MCYDKNCEEVTRCKYTSIMSVKRHFQNLMYIYVMHTWADFFALRCLLCKNMPLMFRKKVFSIIH